MLQNIKMSFYSFFVFVFVSSSCGVLAQFSASLAVPGDIEGVHLISLDVIATCWQQTPGATRYEVQAVFPDLTTENFNVSQPGFVLEEVNVGSSETYTFKVRQWSGVRYSRFSEQISVTVSHEAEDTAVGENTTESMNYMVYINGTSTFTWSDSPKFDDNNFCLTYTMEVCMRANLYHEYTTPESLVSDVRILEHFNEETNKTETLMLKQHTIYYDQPHIDLIGYANVSCQTVTSDKVRFDVDDLFQGFNYTYLVNVYQGGRLLGILYEGMFVGTGYVVPVVIVEEVVSPLGVYLLTCAALIGILLLCFILALITGWDRVVNDVAVRKDKMRKKKDAEMEDKTRGRLLTEGFINEQTQEPFPVFS